MYQYTTPTFRIHIPSSVAVTSMTSLVVTFEQKTTNVKIRKSLNEVQLDSDENLIIVSLTQEETGQFEPDEDVKAQCHIKIGSAALATKEMKVDVCENINGKVI